MKKTFIALALLSSSVSAVELSDFDLNPLVGLSFGAGSGETNGASGSLTLGAEVIYKDQFLIGLSGYDVDRNYGGNPSTSFENEYRSVWAGYFVTSDVALKLGYTRQDESFVSKYTSPDFVNGGVKESYSAGDWSMNYVMIGAGYHVTENLNFNLHINIPTGGNFSHYAPKSNYVNSSLMLGYRF
ncbi:MAG: hypothetical protein ACRC2Y_04995 [Aeromonas veronii]